MILAIASTLTGRSSPSTVPSIQNGARGHGRGHFAQVADRQRTGDEGVVGKITERAL